VYNLNLMGLSSLRSQVCATRQHVKTSYAIFNNRMLRFISITYRPITTGLEDTAYVCHYAYTALYMI